jgi:hypothetical protein
MCPARSSIMSQYNSKYTAYNLTPSFCSMETQNLLKEHEAHSLSHRPATQRGSELLYWGNEPRYHDTTICVAQRVAATAASASAEATGRSVSSGSGGAAHSLLRTAPFTGATNNGYAVPSASLNAVTASAWDRTSESRPRDRVRLRD